MVSLPPLSSPPVQPALPGAPPPPVLVPAQVVSADLTSQLLRELTLPVSSVTVTQTPTTQQPVPSPAQLILNASAPPQQAPAATPAPILLQLQTPQGTIQLALPATALPQQAQPGLPIPLPATLTAPQWQQLVAQGHVQLQIAPVPAALLQRLAPGTPPLLAQLILQPRDLARLLGTPLPTSTTTATLPIQIGLGSAPSTFTATILPPALAESYKARFVVTTEAALQNQPAASHANVPNTILQTAAASVRSWFEALKPGAAPSSSAQIMPTLNAEQAVTTTLPMPAANAEPAPTLNAPLRQVAVTLVTTPPSATPAALSVQPQTVTANQGVETAARLLGLTPSGEKLIETGDGQVLLAPAALPLALGKPSTLRLAPLTEATVTLQPERAPTLASTQPALNEALDALTAAAPALAQRLAGQVLLQPNAPLGNLAPSLLFLMAAVGIYPAPATPGKPNSGPALAPALREALDTIDSARPATSATTPLPPLAERLLAELRQLGDGRTVLDDAGQPWRGFTLPTLMGDQANNTVQTPINLYIQQPPPQRQDQQQRGDAQTSAGTVKQTRFIVDMQLSRLGTTQLEGLSRARQLDLTLRTHTALPLTLQSELTARYTEIASATGLVGTLQFGAGPGKGQWFTPRENSGAPQVNARL